MPFTQADADALRAAIADGRGARTISFGDQSVTFNSIDDMLKLLSIMQADVNATSGAQTRTRLAATSKGV